MPYGFFSLNSLFLMRVSDQKLNKKFQHEIYEHADFLVTIPIPFVWDHIHDIIDECKRELENKLDESNTM